MFLQSILDRCIACDVILDDDDLVYSDASGGVIHASCCGQDRENFVNDEAQPLKSAEPIPTPWRWGDLD